MFRFNHSRLQIQQKLGKGRFGTVFPYQKDPQDLKWVVKRIKAEDSDSLLASLPEIVLGFACDHPRIVPVKGYFIEKDSDNVAFNVYMKMPRMKETLANDFKARKRQNNRYSEQEIISHFYSLVHGIGYLHSKKIYHGDIKPDNLLLDANGALMIGDIGIAKHVEEEDSYQTLTGQAGTYQYSAPEIMGLDMGDKKKERLAKADVWSLGVVILELCYFDFRLLNALLPQDKLKERISELIGNLAGKYSSSIVNLLKRVLDLDPISRPEIADIKTELETNFSQLLDKDLLNVAHVDERPKIEQPLKEISEKYEAEISYLKEEISQLKLELVQQKSRQDQSNKHAREDYSKQDIENNFYQERIKGLEQQLRDEHQRQFESIASSNEKLATKEQQIRILEQDKTSHEQRSKDLEKYIETTVKEQMKAYETQIKTLNESLFQEKKTLQLKVTEIEALKVQAKRVNFGEDYKANLKKVVVQLNTKWEKNFFKFEATDRLLRISARSFQVSITDENMSGLLKDLIEKLGQNNLLNLFGLEISFSHCPQLTGKAIKELTTAISSQLLHLQHLELYFGYNKRLNDNDLEELAIALSNQSLHLEYLGLSFPVCEQLTDKALESLTKAIASQSCQLQELRLDFPLNPKITDAGVESLSAVIEQSCKNLKQLDLDFRNCKKLQIKRKIYSRKDLHTYRHCRSCKRQIN